MILFHTQTLLPILERFFVHNIATHKQQIVTNTVYTIQIESPMWFEKDSWVMVSGLDVLYIVKCESNLWLFFTSVFESHCLTIARQTEMFRRDVNSNVMCIDRRHGVDSCRKAISLFSPIVIQKVTFILPIFYNTSLLMKFTVWQHQISHNEWWGPLHVFWFGGEY